MLVSYLVDPEARQESLLPEAECQLSKIGSQDQLTNGDDQRKFLRSWYILLTSHIHPELLFSGVVDEIGDRSPLDRSQFIATSLV